MRKKRLLSLTLLLMVSILTGCATMGDTLNMVKDLSANGGAGSQWTNSEIVGAINADTPTDVKTDYFTAVNKDWLLEQDPESDENKQILFITELMELVKDRKLGIIADPASIAALDGTPVGLSAEELTHTAELVENFANAVGSTDQRIAKGAEPLRPYLESIESITTMDELKAFMTDFDGMNVVGAPFVDINVATTRADRETYSVILAPLNRNILFLADPDQYTDMDADGIKLKGERADIIRLVLRKLDYSEEQINAYLRGAFRLEGRLAEHMADIYTVQSAKYEDEEGSLLTLEEAQSQMGDYPISDILRAYGYDVADRYLVMEPYFLEAIQNSFTEKYLEEYKDYYIVATVWAAADLLDPETKDAVNDILTREEPADTQSADGDTDDSMSDAEVLLEQYIEPYLRAPLEMLYIAKYCDPEQKQAIMDLTAQVKEAFESLLVDNIWLADTGRANALEKLRFMEKQALYPETYISYLDLDLSADEDLIAMVRDIRNFEMRRYAAKIGQKIDRGEWNLAEIPTTEVNAFNYISSNTIYILAGITADEYVFDKDAPLEQNLARLGTVIGHEMTHGFDTTGCEFDKYGKEYAPGEDSLLTLSEELEFQKRSISLSLYYHAISPMPGMAVYDADVSAEAIADLGGMTNSLILAAQNEDFDYDLFFRSYAQLWRKSTTEEMEAITAKGDNHPLAYLRVNVVLAQFDEFMNTYNVQPGDGMYIAPEKRILVW